MTEELPPAEPFDIKDPVHQRFFGGMLVGKICNTDAFNDLPHYTQDNLLPQVTAAINDAIDVASRTNIGKWPEQK